MQLQVATAATAAAAAAAAVGAVLLLRRHSKRQPHEGPLEIEIRCCGPRKFAEQGANANTMREPVLQPAKDLPRRAEDVAGARHGTHARADDARPGRAENVHEGLPGPFVEIMPVAKVVDHVTGA